MKPPIVVAMAIAVLSLGCQRDLTQSPMRPALSSSLLEDQFGQARQLVAYSRVYFGPYESFAPTVEVILVNMGENTIEMRQDPYMGLDAKYEVRHGSGRFVVFHPERIAGIYQLCKRKSGSARGELVSDLDDPYTLSKGEWIVYRWKARPDDFPDGAPKKAMLMVGIIWWRPDDTTGSIGYEFHYTAPGFICEPE